LQPKGNTMHLIRNGIHHGCYCMTERMGDWVAADMLPRATRAHYIIQWCKRNLYKMHTKYMVSYHERGIKFALNGIIRIKI
jgi:hypothetical protein